MRIDDIEKAKMAVLLKKLMEINIFDGETEGTDWGGKVYSNPHHTTGFQKGNKSILRKGVGTFQLYSFEYLEQIFAFLKKMKVTQLGIQMKKEGDHPIQLFAYNKQGDKIEYSLILAPRIPAGDSFERPKDRKKKRQPKKAPQPPAEPDKGE